MTLKNQEESLCSVIKFRTNGFVMEDCRGENSNGFDKLWDVSCGGLGNSHDYNHERKADKVSSDDDIVDLLPRDPFGMDVSATFTAITGCIEDFGLKNLRFESSSKGPPPDALFFALGYLDLRDLLSVERVCKSLRVAVQNDPLLWQNFHVSYPLCHKITDDTLLWLTNRAQGSLHSLSIVECLKITDGGLKRVLEMNPGLTKLSVAGCLRLGIEGTLSSLRFFKSVGRPGIKRLRIGGLLGVTSQHFEELKLLLGAENQNRVSAHKPRFFRAGQLYLSFDDERPIDMEICPRCQQLRQVYDCPADSCRGKQHAAQVCKACTFCIVRCINCGRCLNNCDYEETFFLELLCLDCLKQVLNCQDRQKRVTISQSTCIFINGKVTISSYMARGF